MDEDFPDEAYLMVTQLPWEDEIIWSGEEARARVLQSQKTKALAAGWIPSTSHRTAQQFLQQSEFLIIFDVIYENPTYGGTKTGSDQMLPFLSGF